MASSTALHELVLQVDSFLGKGMLEDTLTAEEVQLMRAQDVLEVTVHGQTTEMISIEGLEEKFQTERGSTRVTIPNRDILEHQWKAGLTLDVTTKDVLDKLSNAYNEMYLKKDEVLKKEERQLDNQLQEFANCNQTADVTAKQITNIFESAVFVGSPNPDVKRKIERKMHDSLKEVDTAAQKSMIMMELRGVLQEGVENHMLTKDVTTKSMWGALNNRRGQVSENKVALAMNQALQEFGGMSVSGLKTHTHLCDIFDKLKIDLTHKNTKNPKTGKIQTTSEVELDNISTWLEQDTLVVNIVETKTSELKPWKTVDPAKKLKDQVSTRLAKDAYKQIVKSVKTFKEMYPDVLNSSMIKIR